MDRANSGQGMVWRFQSEDSQDIALLIGVVESPRSNHPGARHPSLSKEGNFHNLYRSAIELLEILLKLGYCLKPESRTLAVQGSKIGGPA